MNSKEEIYFFKNNGYLMHPKVLQFEVTNNCPLQCPQCYKDVENIRNMDIELLKRMVVEGAGYGAKRAMINGGEPLMYPHLIEAIRFMNQHGIVPTCFSSGVGLDDRLAIEMGQLNMELLLSFNGSTKEIHSLSRDGFEVTYEAAMKLNEHNTPFAINWVARHDNVDDFEDFLKFARGINAKGVTVVCNKLSGEYEINSPLTNEDFEKIRKIIRRDINEKYVEIQNCNNILAVYSYNMPYSRLYGCPAGIISCTVTVDGKFVPCPHLYFKEEFSSILDYWYNSVKLNELRKFTTDTLSHCSGCARNDKCRFCKAISLKSHGDFSKGYEECPIYIER